jgi:heme a synthase
MGRLRLSPRAYQWITLVAAILLALIIVTGAAVRLTGSGLGCPEWPNCTKGSFASSSSDYHATVEFANRVVTGLVSFAVIVAVLGSLVRLPRRRDLIWLSLGLVLGVIAQALLGALVVEELLDPPFVMGHFLLSAVLLADAIVLHHRAGLPDGTRSRPAFGPGPIWMGRLLVFAVSVVLVTGTVVTGAGPHSGDAGSGASLRATRLDLAVPEVARIHGTSVMAFLALVLITLLLMTRQTGPRRGRVLLRLEILLGLVIAQGALGYYQYFNGVPRLAVGFHVAGATAVFSATMIVLLSMYEPVRVRPGLTEQPGLDDIVPVSRSGSAPVEPATPAPAAPQAPTPSDAGVQGALFPGQ